MLHLARAVIYAAAFLELSEDDEVDPDAAVKALENMASCLHGASAEELAALREVLASERQNWLELGYTNGIVDFFDTFFEAFGLTPPFE